MERKSKKVEVPHTYVLSDEEYRSILRRGFVERGSREIPIVDALLLNSIGVIKIDKDTIDKARNIPNIDRRIRVMKELLKRGYISRSGVYEKYIRVYRKGMRVGEDRTRWIVRIVDSMSEVNGDTINELLERAQDMRKSGVICVLPSESEDTVFISVSKKVFR